MEPGREQPLRSLTSARANGFVQDERSQQRAGQWRTEGELGNQSWREVSLQALIALWSLLGSTSCCLLSFHLLWQSEQKHRDWVDKHKLFCKFQSSHVKTSLPDNNVPWWKHVNCPCQTQVSSFMEILWVCRGQKYRARALWSVSSHLPAGLLVPTVSVKKERWLQDLLRSACYFASHLFLN